MKKEYPECIRCGRQLRSPKARELGFGPVCWAKQQASQVPAEKSTK